MADDLATPEPPTPAAEAQAAQAAREAAAARVARPHRAGIPVPPEESEAEPDYSVLPSDRQQADAGGHERRCRRDNPEKVSFPIVCPAASHHIQIDGMGRISSLLRPGHQARQTATNPHILGRP